MSEQDTIAVIGAGIIGAAVAYALAREGRRVLLLDRAAPGIRMWGARRHEPRRRNPERRSRVVEYLA